MSELIERLKVCQSGYLNEAGLQDACLQTMGWRKPLGRPGSPDWVNPSGAYVHWHMTLNPLSSLDAVIEWIEREVTYDWSVGKVKKADGFVACTDKHHKSFRAATPAIALLIAGLTARTGRPALREETKDV